jgi:HEAT repeat protein
MARRRGIERVASVAGRRESHDNADARCLLKALESASGHTERARLRNAVIGLGQEAAPALEDGLKSPDAMMRWECVNLLGVIAAPSSARTVVSFALSEDEVHARWRAYWAASRFDHRSILPLLDNALLSPVSTHRWRAALLLSVLRRPQGAEILIDGLKSQDAWERYEALSAIRSLALRGCEEDVGRCLGRHEPDYIRQQATLTLGAMRSQTARGLLVRALRDPEPQVRWRASMALARSGRGSIRTLKARLKHEPDPMVRRRIIDDLRRLEGEA